MTALERDFSPISDWRASADYRMTVAKNLLRRCFIETTAPGQRDTAGGPRRHRDPGLCPCLKRRSKAACRSRCATTAGTSTSPARPPTSTTCRSRRGLLHIALGLSTVAHGRIRKLDLAPVRAAEGVALVLTAADVPGVNDISPTHRHDEPILAEETVEYVGQPIFRRGGAHARSGAARGAAGGDRLRGAAGRC